MKSLHPSLVEWDHETIHFTFQFVYYTQNFIDNYNTNLLIV
jgi:hypothetical protein